MSDRPGSHGDGDHGVAEEIAPFYVMEMVRAAEARLAAGGDVLHLEVGQPSTGAPAAVADAAVAALRSGDPLGYSEAKGRLALRRRIARHYEDRYGLEVDAEQLLATVGSSVGFVLAFLAAFRPDARVAVAEPGYPCYRNTLRALGREPVGVPVGPETGYNLTPDLLDAACRRGGALAGVVVASPANPTGTILRPDELAAVAGWCGANGARLVSDEIYHGLSYGRPTTCARTLDPGAIVVNSFSKYWSMTGWRLGWVVLPDDLVGRAERLAQNLVICPPVVGQQAALAAFEPAAVAELEGHVERYRANRTVLLEGLPRAGIDRLAPADGAFYVYAEVGHLTDDSLALCHRWLADIGVAATPGIDFDPVRGHRTVRFSFAGATADMVEAAHRLERWVAHSR